VAGKCTRQIAISLPPPGGRAPEGVSEKTLVLLSGSVTGSEGGIPSGLGAVLSADTRNSPFLPNEGGYCKLSFLTAVDWLGNTFSFGRWILDLRYYLSMSSSLVLAMQVFGTAITGDLPFILLALGGDNIMRGYYEGRYRGRAKGKTHKAMGTGRVGGDR